MTGIVALIIWGVVIVAIASMMCRPARGRHVRGLGPVHVRTVVDDFWNPDLSSMDDSGFWAAIAADLKAGR